VRKKGGHNEKRTWFLLHSNDPFSATWREKKIRVGQLSSLKRKSLGSGRRGKSHEKERKPGENAQGESSLKPRGPWEALEGSRESAPD